MSSAPATTAPDAALAVLRREIDDIDQALHRLLMERGAIIDRLIAVKARGGGGSAFRPEREAAMMRRLVERHRGLLPLDTVEGIWRIIISTFTYVQAPYTVHADVSGGDPPMRDSCRFHFGFTVPLAPQASPAAVVAAVAAAAGDLGLIRVETAGAPWWDDLRAPEAPKIIARLPFVERADHAAGLPLFVVAKPLADAAPRDVLLHAVRVGAGWNRRAAADIVAQASTREGASLLVTGAADAASLAAALDVALADVACVGSHAARYAHAPAVELATERA